MLRLRRLPSIVWVFIFVGAIVALIASIIGLFYLLSHVEGVASVIMLAAAWGVIRAVSPAPTADSASFAVPGWVNALGITFFALMGLAIDQTGNALYNKPLEWLFCPAHTELRRDIEVMTPRPGETVVTQAFLCVEPKENQIVDGIGMFEVLGIRFVEYVLIGYALIGLNRLYTLARARRASFSTQQG